MKNLLLLCICLLLAVPCGARTITVNWDGSGDYLTIQAAINDSNDGDTIIVRDGAYTGSGNRDIDFLGKAITVRSENGPENCIIDCQGTEADPHRGFYFHSGEDENSVLAGLTITNGYGPLEEFGSYMRSTGGGIFCETASPTINNCTIDGNRSGYFGGGIACEYSSPRVINCIISNNSSDMGAGGVYLKGQGPNPALFYGCVISGNSAEVGGAIETYNYCNAMLTNCTFSGNSAQWWCVAMLVDWYSSPTVTNCIFWDANAVSGYEIGLECTSTILISYSDIQHGENGVLVSFDSTVNWYSGNIDADPSFVNPYINDYHLLPTSPCIDAGDNTAVPPSVNVDLDGNPRFVDVPYVPDTGNGTPPIVDMGAYEFQVRWYVDADATGANDGSSWANAYNYLQDALADANSGDEVRVAEGIYKPDLGTNQTPGDQDATFQLINGVTIKGSYAGFGESDPNARDVELYETILSGDLDGNDVDVNNPADLLDEPTRAENSYHVVTGSGTDSTAVLDGFTISAGNYNLPGGPLPSGGGGMYNYFGTPTLANCTFSYNSAGDGGGMYNAYSSPTLVNCTFRHNLASGAGGGMCSGSSSPTLINCTFNNNSADGGGGMSNSYNSYPTLTNCTFNNNSAGDYGGGMYNYWCNPILTNCIFVRNSANNMGGAIYITRTSSVTLTNCTFVANSATSGNALVCYTWHPEHPPSNLQITNCILWDGGNEIWKNDDSTITIIYSDIQDGWTGEGNIDADPYFANPANNDYHLKSQAGRWDPNSQSWVEDQVKSPCIDAGDPNSDWTEEFWPHGKRINMGTYGGTPQASMSLSNVGNVADLNNDDSVDYKDLMRFADDWLYQQILLSEDLDRNGIVNFTDFAIFVNNWLWQQ